MAMNRGLSLDGFCLILKSYNENLYISIVCHWLPYECYLIPSAFMCDKDFENKQLYTHYHLILQMLFNQILFSL